jgi:Polysaccharide deacetylase
MKTVPLLITVDVEIARDHELAAQSEILRRLQTDLQQMPITCFCTADAADEFAAPLQKLAADGHEIGCHGLDHSPNDNYRTMSAAQAVIAIQLATDRISQATGQRPQNFRGPSMTTSSGTQQALIQHGYSGDFSACAQRVDLLSCAGANTAWLNAPRGSYQPAVDRPFRWGDLPLTVVNLSCMGIPFLSGMLFLGGVGFMKMFFRLLLFEARIRGFPIVYLFHSYEFTPLTQTGQQPWHHGFYQTDRERRYQMNLELLRYMCSLPEIKPLTAHQFLSKKY